MLRTILRASGAVLVLALGACGTGGDDDGNAADAISSSLTADSDQALQVTDEQADCVGEGFVDDIGTDKLTDYGILTEDLEASDKALDTKMDKADAEAAAAVLVGCPDEALTDEVVTDFFAATFAQDTALAAEAMTPLQECMAG